MFEQIIPKQIIVGDEDAKKYAETLNGKSITAEGVITKCKFQTHNAFNKRKPAYSTRLELTQMVFSPPLKR